MKGCLLFFGLLLAACPRPKPTEEPPASLGATSAEAATQSASSPGSAGALPQNNQPSKNNCDPLPRAKAPCDKKVDSYCVIDWGKPGGHSTALWCRDGRWVIEEEVNLP